MAGIRKPRPRTEPARLVLTSSPPATDQPLAPAGITAVARRSAIKEEKVMLQKIRAAKENESGFTLIELLIVIVILGVLAAIVVFSVGGINDTSKASACKSDAKNVEIASEAFYTQQTPHAYAASMDALVTAKFLREVPSTTNGYTISYSAATGAVTATGACTV
jgi:prepilin-type N-terminal cleavage/methylation domain-containing protein